VEPGLPGRALEVQGGSPELPQEEGLQGGVVEEERRRGHAVLDQAVVRAAGSLAQHA